MLLILDFFLAIINSKSKANNYYKFTKYAPSKISYKVK